MPHTIFHIEDEPKNVQDRVYGLIKRAADAGMQMTPLDFTATKYGDLFIDGMYADEWMDAMTMD